MIDFSQIHVLLVGDVMLDEFIYGTSNRKSPEFDAPVIDVLDKKHNPGGAANVYENIINLGASCTLFGVIGKDQAGSQLRSILENH